MNLLHMNPAKLKYKNEIVFFFIVVFGSVIMYYGLGKLCNKKSIIEGVTTKNVENKCATNKEDSLEIKEMKQKLKIMNNNIMNKVEPKLNKILEKVKNVGDEINAGIKNETGSKLNSFSESNNKATAVSKQDKVPPFSASEIKNAI